MRPILSGVINLRQCPITSHDCQESSDFIDHCLKAMTPDKIRRIGRIFDMFVPRLSTIWAYAMLLFNVVRLRLAGV